MALGKASQPRLMPKNQCDKPIRLMAIIKLMRVDLKVIYCVAGLGKQRVHAIIPI